MLDYTKILIDGGITAFLFTIPIIIGFAISPRLFLNKGDYPPDVFEAAPPKTPKEQRQALWISIPFLIVVMGFPLYSVVSFKNTLSGDPSFWLLFLHTFLVSLVPFFWDLIVLDWIMFCTITPSFVVIPGTEGFAGYKDKSFHLKAHTKGIFITAAGALLITGIAWLI